MTASAIERVRPVGFRHEGLALLALFIAILLIQWLYIRELGREEKPQEILAWQISSFAGLSGADQAIYNALFTVKDEIPYIYDEINYYNEAGEVFRWPNVEDFQQYLLPPFYQDSSWVQNGSLQWQLYQPLAKGEMQGYSMYLGTHGTLAGQGSFLLTIGHVHAGFQNNNAMEIWYHPDGNLEMPESGFKDTLIRQGWKYVVPYSGDLEVQRIYGE